MMKETLEKLLKEHYYKTSLCKVFPTYEYFVTGEKVGDCAKMN